MAPVLADHMKANIVLALLRATVLGVSVPRLTTPEWRRGRRMRQCPVARHRAHGSRRNPHSHRSTFVPPFPAFAQADSEDDVNRPDPAREGPPE